MSAPPQSSGIGCVLALATFNLVPMGLLAFAFAHGPYSSGVQEAWYRFGSIGFVLFGAILPAIFAWRARHSTRILVALVGWLLIALAVFLHYAMMSGGGV